MPILIDQSAEVTCSFDAEGLLETARMRWWVHGTPDEPTATGLVLTAAPATYDSLFLQGLNAQTDDSLKWLFDVDYGRRDPDESEYGFEIGTQSQKIMYAKAQRTYNVGSSTAPDVGLAIGVTPDGIDGVDALIPTYQFTERHLLTDAQVTATYKAALFATTGKVNDATFKGFAAGEVLFLGSTGAKRGRAKWEVTYRFAASKNFNGAHAGATSVRKDGWEYLWVLSADKVDNTAKAMTKQARGVYAAQIYDPTDFSVLGIGT